MHLDPITGLWKNDDNDYQPAPSNSWMEDIHAEEEDRVKSNIPPPPPLDGKCTLSIRFETPEDYLRWKYYFKGREWEFMVNYPAIMRADLEFHNSLDVEIITKKIVQLLQNGFEVYSANWKLEDQKNEKDEKK